MDVLHAGHWIGLSVSYLPKDTLFSIEKYFHVIESGHDISIVSEDNVQFCFFFLDIDNNYPLLLSAVKLCQNLNKSLIILYKNKVNPEILELDTVYDSFQLNGQDIDPWLQELSKNIHYKFSDHQSIMDIHKKEPYLSENKISKDLLEVLRYIEGNISKSIREEDIADYCHYSVTYFSKVFHKAIGISFRDYLMSKRIALAKKMLLADKKTKIAFVAYQCGYNDVSYFSRIFKKKTGFSPGTFRRIN
ncbi:helix-turn-helix transcriptional regulator [Vibrio sp. SCSIO 43135]|uniref:helix-turn-helix domain-containing protein n=1 Tax=Vibrio sp. SCSIO 43135 TaxID=2819096 RepID=UPI0020761225|nr:AraC family transcriptional regulator [Vibrio sp. SCSIO 43135]USD40638.1 helix-turn-helix transcriptional regulator [Vibrio sp. SCSIO 43135]